MSASPSFTIHNLPYGVISIDKPDDPLPPCLECAIAYEDFAIRVKAAVKTCHFDSLGNWFQENVFLAPSWNAFASLPFDIRQQFRQCLVVFIKAKKTDRHEDLFVKLSKVRMHLPMDSRNYSDFYCSYEHAKNCSEVFNLLIPPNWYHLPQVYNGRTSSLAVSGTPIVRPMGIFPLQPGVPPSFQAENKLDFELEMGVWISNGVGRGQRLDIANAKNHIFGITLLNDWSARSIQFAEMQPLGPFHSKGSLTSVSPWIIPTEALDELASCARHSEQEPKPLPHLTLRNMSKATWDIHVQCIVIRDGKEYVFSDSNLNELHWTPLQQITHLASAGEGLSSGDVFGTGTISSSRTNEQGEKTGLSCIWERQLSSARLSSLPEDINETLLKDGDEVVMTAWCNDPKTGEKAVWFGECRGQVSPAIRP